MPNGTTATSTPISSILISDEATGTITEVININGVSNTKSLKAQKYFLKSARLTNPLSGPIPASGIGNARLILSFQYEGVTGKGPLGNTVNKIATIVTTLAADRKITSCFADVDNRAEDFCEALGGELASASGLCDSIDVAGTISTQTQFCINGICQDFQEADCGTGEYLAGIDRFGKPHCLTLPSYPCSATYEYLAGTNADGTPICRPLFFNANCPIGPPQQFIKSYSPYAGTVTCSPNTNVGPPGDQGLPGPKGLTGDTGPQGPIGNTGGTGAVGPQGPAGPQGPKGPTGPGGIQGIQGPQGPWGATGPTGGRGRDCGPISAPGCNYW